jgi:phenylalanyl-tRNA synthetase beta chain
MCFELELDALTRRDIPVFQSVSRQQPVERDLALVVPESVGHDQLMQSIHGAATQGLLKGAVLFDVYRPQQASGGLQPGEKSLAVRLTLQSDEATLTEARIEAAVAAIVQRAEQDLGARLRS